MKKSKLSRTGDWIWRDGEIGYKTFQNLSKEKKQEHINFLISIKKENLSTNDWYILNNYAPTKILEEKSKPFLSMEDNQIQL